MPVHNLHFQRELTGAALRLAAGATVDDLFGSIAPVLCEAFGLRGVTLAAEAGLKREFGTHGGILAGDSKSYPVVLGGRSFGAIEISFGAGHSSVPTLDAAMRQICSLFALALDRAYRDDSAGQREEWRSLFDEHPAPLMVYAIDTATIVAVNSAFCESYGYDPDELPGRRFTEVCIPDAEYADLIGTDPSVGSPPVRCRHHKRDGTRLDVEVTTRYCLWMGEPACIALINDVTSRTRIERRLVKSEKRLERVQEMGGVGIFEVDFLNGQRYWSKELRRQFGFDEHDDPPQVKQLMLDAVHPDDREIVRAAYARAIKERAACRVDHRVVQPSGNVLWLQLQADLDFDETGTPIRAIGTTVDITDRKSAEEQLGFLAHYDPLTGLANRANAMSRLQNLVQTARRKQSTPALLFLDVDHFKEINDTLGHEAGDQVLIEVGRRLQETLRDSDCVARVGGDEFVVILGGNSDADGAQLVARRILAAIEKPMSVAAREIVLTCSIGVALLPREGIDVEGLLGRADMAMYEAKRSGRNRVAVYEDEMLRATVQRFEIETELRRALEQHEFFLLYQPIIGVSKRDLTGVEALIRWRRSDGIRAPDQFIPIAEESDLILGIGDWVLEEACRQGLLWLRDQPALCMSVNVSRRQLSDPEYGARTLRILREAGFDPKRLQLELTETALLSDLERAQSTLHTLRQAGIRIAIDDFGTGYNSLANLRHSVIDALKIDRSFVSGIATRPSDMAIAGAVVSAGRSLGVRVIAEGVETEDHYETLRRLGCDDAQGFWFCEPVEAQAFEERYVRPPSSSRISA